MLVKFCCIEGFVHAVSIFHSLITRTAMHKGCIAYTRIHRIRGVPFQTYLKHMDVFCQANIYLVEQL